MDRLAALGVIHSSFVGLRPWTRTSVYLMIREAADANLSSEASELLNALRSEFRRENELESGIENEAVSLDTIYSRSQYISGSPLNDGFHFNCR